MRIKSFLFFSGISLSLFAQPSTTVSLDSCRNMALANNKELMISREKIKASDYQKREAFSAYLPGIDFSGGYLYNQKNLSVFDSDQMLPTKTFNPATQSYEFNLAKNPLTGEPIKQPNGQYVPETVALIPKDAMEFDIHNVFFGAITLTQPIYMGGKIRALNEIAQYAEQLSRTLSDGEAQNVIYAVDAAYWQVVSLKAKYRLAKSYVELLDSLDRNVGLMVEQGVATRSNKLSVDVKLNSANVDLTKVENGLVLSRMALAQVCGLPVNTVFTLQDEDIDEVNDFIMPQRDYDMEEVFASRDDLKALQIGIDISGKQVDLARSSMLPNLALVGTYSFSNPNMFNGFSKRFNGAFSVGAMLTVPLWHWGGNYYKYKRAQSDQTMMRMQMEDARDLVTLQVSQASFRADESLKTYLTTKSNLKSANENLRSAQIGFREGVATSDDVMEAQTAWLKANSECIDAMIDVHLCDTYLKKVLGKLN